MEKIITTEIVIHASKEKVWELLTDFENYKNWNPFIVQSTGKAIAGTRLTNTVKNNGKTFTFKPLLLTVEPYCAMAWLGSLWVKGLFDGHHYFRIEDLGNGQVLLTHGERFSGILSGFLLRSLGNETRKNFVQMNNALKQQAEKSS